jgi:flagellar hook-basal body complex protein FliE
MINPVSLTTAFEAALSAGGPKQKAALADGAGAGFADMLMEAGKAAASKLDHAESVAMQSLKGDFDPRMVADAVMTAERTLQTAIVIRDKIVTAYLEISRMAI